MPFDPTAFAEAAKEALGIAKPIVEDAVQQKYDSAHKYRMEAWNEAQSIDDPVVRADKSWASLMQLFKDSGTSQRCVGRETTLPIDAVAKLFELASEGVRDKALLNRKK